LTVHETARRVASSVHALRAMYPNAKIIDADIPTGKPVDEWRAVLAEWLQDYEDLGGESFYGLSMDIWWAFPWRESVPATIPILKKHGVRAGIFIDAIGRPGLTAAMWMAAAKRNACDLHHT